MEFNPEPLRIDLVEGLQVERVKLRFGLGQSVPGMVAKLTAFDAAGVLLASAEAPPIDGPTAVDRPLELVLAGEQVRRLEVLLFTGATVSAERIDDLEIHTKTPPVCPLETDLTPPAVSIARPLAGGSWFTKSIDLLAGSIYEASGKLSSVEVEIEGPTGTGRYAFDLTHRLSSAPGSPDFEFAAGNVAIYVGANRITVRAKDDACPPNRRGFRCADSDGSAPSAQLLRPRRRGHAGDPGQAADADGGLGGQRT